MLPKEKVRGNRDRRTEVSKHKTVAAATARIQTNERRPLRLGCSLELRVGRLVQLPVRLAQLRLVLQRHLRCHVVAHFILMATKPNKLGPLVLGSVLPIAAHRSSHCFILHSPPPVKLRGLFGNRFLCRVLVLLRKILDFLAFPLNLCVVN